MKFMEFKATFTLDLKVHGIRGSSEGKLISFLLFYIKGNSEQTDYVDYPKSQGKKVADPGI